ncbi:MAG: cation:proton antiporter [Candidatus Heimdallarchaeota archaeon]|nr:cation:proton antiporter [Candidatus Heimdallarchaeota archaeon]MCK5144073.1 cation:proton antiporter [Candidatus Heimdallarchaeota archaeon]
MSEQVLRILLFIGIGLLSARILGEIFERIKLSSILGELLAGVLIGGPIFRLFGDKGSEVLAKFMDGEVLEQFSQIGILLLLFIVGMEINIGDLRKIGKNSLLISLLEVTTALVGGILTGYFIIKQDILFAIFFGTLFTATSIGVTVRTLGSLGKLGSKEGQTTLSVAVFDDFIALLLVLVLSGALFAPEGGNWILTILKDLGFLAAFILFVMFILPRILNFLENNYNIFSSAKTPYFALGIIFGILVLINYFAEELHFSGVVMAFLLGLSLQQNKLIIGEIKEPIVKFGEGIFIPLFFFSVGSNFDFTSGGISFIMVLVILLAILSKGIGTFTGSRVVGFNNRSALKIAVGTSPRAEIVLVIAGIGVQHGIFDSNVYTIAIMLVFVTVIMTPLLLKLVYRERKKGDSELASIIEEKILAETSVEHEDLKKD